MSNKTLKIATLALAGGLFAAPAFAQVGLGVKGGVNFSKATFKQGDETAEGIDYGMGFMGGLGLSMDAGPIGVLVDVLWAQRGFDTSIGDVDVKSRYSTVYVPVQAKFSLIPMFYLSAGGYYSMAFGDVKTKATSDGNSISTTTSLEDAGFKSSDYGLVGGLGVEFPLGGMSFTAEARYNYGLANLAKDPPDDYSVKGQAIDVLVGLKF